MSGPLASAVATILLALLRGTADVQAYSGDGASMRAIAKALGTDRSLGWSLSGDPCNWQHVSCAGGRVTAIQIGNQNVSGTLAPEVGDLTGLVRLELQTNQIAGPLPSLSGLVNLQVLFLHDNLFTFVPSDFFTGLSSLQAVTLDNNPFEPWQIPASLADAYPLVNFSANAANVTGTVPDFFGTAFSGLSRLALAQNLLQGGIPPNFSGSSLQSLWLNNQRGSTRLSGAIDVVQSMTALTQLWLQSNAFSGPLPNFSGLTALRELQLRDNQFTGLVPQSLIWLPALSTVTLTNNLLQGPVPVFPKTVTVVDAEPESESFCLTTPGSCDPRVTLLLSVSESFGYPTRFAESWKGNDPCVGWLGIVCDAGGNISVINFQRMGLSGKISPAFSQFRSLQRLLLSNNNITGTIPLELATLWGLKELDLSNNFLYGQLPYFSIYVLLNITGNPDIGKGDPSAPSSGGNGESLAKGSSNSVGVVVGSVLGSAFGLSLLGLLLFVAYKKQQRSCGRVQGQKIHPPHPGSDAELLKIKVSRSGVVGGDGSETCSHSDLNVVDTRNLLISIQVLRNVTSNFREENILGRGGFGTVYRGDLQDGTKIAVKRMESGVTGSKGLAEFKSEIAVLTKVRHRNLVSLLGYCLDGNERLLVYECMPQGTLGRHLFRWKEEGLKPLGWKRRLTIALDVARGVEYLHNLAHQSFIHRDLKPSNILLGDDMRAKVSDFGLVRLVPDDKCSIETRLAGTFGYLAPEYAVTGRVTTKADVFSFGVILMELITGRKALDKSQPEESMHLVTWFKRMQLDQATLWKIIDPIIELDEETLASVITVSELAGHCCARELYQRPDMGHAVNVLSSLAELWRPAESGSDDVIDLEMTSPQALEKWQSFEYTLSDGASSSFLASMDNTHNYTHKTIGY